MSGHRSRKGRGKTDDTARCIRMAAIPIIIVVVLLAVIFLVNRNGAKQVGASAKSGSSAAESREIEIQDDASSAAAAENGDESIAPDDNEYSEDFSQYELKKDEIPQVNQLISEYFQAKVDQDAQALFKLFGKAEDEAELKERSEELKAEAVYIEDYQDITCYTKPGLTADSYVAYVTYDVKFRRVDTLAPGLMWCYVVKEDDGNWIIRENVVGDEADYVAKQNQTEDVRLLSAQTNERLRQAIESDTLLAGIYSDLRNGAVVSESEESGGDSSVTIQ